MSWVDPRTTPLATPIVVLMILTILMQSRHRTLMLAGLAGMAYWLWPARIGAPHDSPLFPAVAGAALGGAIGAMTGRLLRSASGYILAGWIGAVALSTIVGASVAGFLWYWDTVFSWIGTSASWTTTHDEAAWQSLSSVAVAPFAALLASLVGTLMRPTT
jgi:hypothetical protein